MIVNDDKDINGKQKWQKKSYGGDNTKQARVLLSLLSLRKGEYLRKVKRNLLKSIYNKTGKQNYYKIISSIDIIINTFNKNIKYFFKKIIWR